MTYEDAIQELLMAAQQATKAADNEDGMPVDALRDIVAEVECIIDHNCTRAEMRNAKALYDGAKLAGLVGGEA